MTGVFWALSPALLRARFGAPEEKGTGAGGGLGLRVGLTRGVAAVNQSCVAWVEAGDIDGEVCVDRPTRRPEPAAVTEASDVRVTEQEVSSVQEAHKPPMTVQYGQYSEQHSLTRSVAEETPYGMDSLPRIGGALDSLPEDDSAGYQQQASGDLRIGVVLDAYLQFEHDGVA
ncbi:hypothetical protein B0H13DRAFT_1854590 [Mycena leptocephala]|nr:hypothetical protein B0H13DRAFT_1854590 [Mycena leptocephala]